MITALLLTPSAWALECASPVQRAELSDALDGAEAAYTDFDDTRFRDGVAEVAGVLLPCMGEALPADLAARTHVVMALHLSMIGDDTNAALSIAAARTAYPTHEVSIDLLPDEHPLRLAMANTPLPPATRTVPEPREGSIAFDGTHTRHRPREQPTIAQLFDETGFAHLTTYLAPREPLPVYRAVPRQRNLLIACAAGSGALATGSYAWSWGRRGALLRGAADPTTPADDLDGARASMNALSVVSATLLGTAATCGVGAAWVGER